VYVYAPVGLAFKLTAFVPVAHMVSGLPEIVGDGKECMVMVTGVDVIVQAPVTTVTLYWQLPIVVPGVIVENPYPAGYELHPLLLQFTSHV